MCCDAQRQALPESSSDRRQESVARCLGAISRSRPVVVTVEAPRICSPLALEIRQLRVIFGFLSQVIPAKTALTCVMNRVPLDDVVRSKREGIAPAPIERIECRLAVRQNDRAR